MAKFSSELHKNVSVLLTLHMSIIIPATNANKTIILEMANVSHVGKDLSTVCQPEHVNATKATDISPKVPMQQLVLLAITLTTLFISSSLANLAHRD